MRRPSLVLAPLALLVLPTMAAAQSAGPGTVPVAAVPAMPVGPGATPVMVAPAEPTPPRVGLDRRVAEDAAVDRAFAAPTALIAPRGTWTLTVRAPVGPVVNGQISYAISDRLELGLGTVLVAAEETSVTSLHAKLQLWRSSRAALAASLDLYTVRDAYEENQLLMPSLVASFCAGGAACRTLVNLHLTGLAAAGEDQVPVLPGVSIVTGGRTQLVGEAHLFNDEQSEASFLTGYLGLRWLSGRFAVEGGLGFYADLSTEAINYADCPADYCQYEDDTVDPEVVPWPFVGVSARL